MMREELLTKDIIKLARSLKRQFVEITPHYICGSDFPTMCTFSIIYLDGSIQVDDDLYFIGPTTDLVKYDIYLENEYIYKRYKPKMDYLRAECVNRENSAKIIFSGDNLVDQDYLIPGFENAVRQKAKEGAQILNVDYTNMFMSCCAAIHPLNKKDIIDLTCYEYDEISYLAKFIINKKKYCITEYIRFLYL